MVLHMPLQGCNIADWGRDMTRERERRVVGENKRAGKSMKERNKKHEGT